MAFLGINDWTPGFDLGASDLISRGSQAINNVQPTGGGAGYGGLRSTAVGPTSTSNPSSGGNVAPGGQVRGASTTAGDGGGAAPDPYEQWGGQDRYNRLVSGFNEQKQNIYGTSTEAAQNQGLGLAGGIRDFMDSLRSGQGKIDTSAINNEMALRQGREGVSGMVGRGIRSGGVMLANKNAADSSAAGAIARAYGDIGRRQLSSVGNQYELGNRNIEQSQADLETQRAAGIRHIQDAKTQAVNNIVMDARGKFAQLDASMADASLPDRINIEQEKEKVRRDVLGKLGYLDQELGKQSGIQPTNLEQRRAESTRLAGLGQAPENSFDYTDQMPAQFQGGGGLPSELPLFSMPRSRRTA